MPKPSTYNKIPIQTRRQLVYLALQEHTSIAQAARFLNIKNSTAKLIVKRFRETNTYFQPKGSKDTQEKQISNQNSAIGVINKEKSQGTQRVQQMAEQRNDECSIPIQEREQEKSSWSPIINGFQQQMFWNFEWSKNYYIVFPNSGFYS